MSTSSIAGAAVVEAPPPKPARIEAADTTLLKFIAAIFIANSHLEAFWPKSWMAADGLIGVEIFFMMAGFGLVLSERSQRRPFPAWYWRRVVRIYPSLILATSATIFLIDHTWIIRTPLGYVHTFIYPTRFPFISQIMVFYVLFFFVLKVRSQTIYPLLMALVAVIYLFVWQYDIHHDFPAHLSLGMRPELISDAAFFQIMLLGGWLGRRVERVKEVRLWEIACLCITFVVYVAAKYVMVVMGRGAWLYPLLHVLSLAIVYFLFRVSQSRPLLDFVRRKSLPAALVTLISALTLEIYFMHYPVLESEHIRQLRFPINLAFFWLVTLIFAWTVFKAATLVRTRLLERRPRAAL